MKLHIDVTQLVHWQGRLTGIPRVMNEISSRYAKDQDVEFVIWDVPSAKFLKVNIQESLRDRGQKLHYHMQGTASRGGSYFTFRALRKLRASGAPIPHSLIKWAGAHSTPQKEHVIRPGDNLFVLWGEQGNDEYISALKKYQASGVGLIQISYDLLPLITPQYSGHSTSTMQKYNSEIFPICGLVLSISEHTKKDIIAWHKEQDLLTPPVEVFRLGDDFELSKPAKPTDALFSGSKLKGDDYLLVVGTIEARKNHTLLYYTYKLAQEKGIKLPKMVIVGRKGWLASDVYEIMKLDPDVNNQFVILESASDEELAWLYTNAKFTVYPSFYEGWGLPIAESIAYGTPCISSNTSSMPEVAGKLVEYFSPYSADECLAQIQGLLEPGNLTVARKNIKKYRPTTWDDTFSQVDQYIKDLYVANS